MWVALPNGSKAGKHIERNARIGVPDVRHRDGEKFRERALAIHADALRVRAKDDAVRQDSCGNDRKRCGLHR